MVNNEKREELKDAIIDILMGDVRRNFLTISDELMNKIIELGWRWDPPVTMENMNFNEVALKIYPDPTPEQEVEILDRIVSGLPMEYLKPANPDGPHTYIKDNLPIDRTPFIVEEYMEKQGEKLTLANVWKRIPEFDNYEVSPLGVIRNRWTKRVLDQTLSGSFMYVDMHDKDGNPHLVSVEHIVTSVFK